MKNNAVSLILILALIILCIPASVVYADDDVAQDYLHVRNQLTDVPGTGDDLASDQNAQSTTPRTYELSGKILGQVTANGNPIIIISCANNLSVEFSIPSTFAAATSDWMSEGNVVRVLVKSQFSSDNAADNGILQLIAAGPEDSVSALEKKMSAIETQIKNRQLQSRMYGSETSRSGYLSSRYVVSGSDIAGLSSRAASIFPAYHDMIARLNPRLSEDDVSNITRSILGYSDEYQIDPRLIVAMIVAESGFDPNSVSRTGAIGLGQLMPETAAELGVSDPYDPQQNIAAAVHILSGHVQDYGGAAPCGVVPINTLMLTMAAYNAGPGAVKKYGGVPPYRETQAYVRRVSELYKELCGS